MASSARSRTLTVEGARRLQDLASRGSHLPDEQCFIGGRGVLAKEVAIYGFGGSHVSDSNCFLIRHLNREGAFLPWKSHQMAPGRSEGF